MCWRFGCSCRFAWRHGCQDAEEPVGLSVGVVERKDVEQLRHAIAVTAGQLDRDSDVPVEVGRRAEAGDQCVDSAWLELAAVIASPTNHLVRRPTCQGFAPGIEPGDNAVGVEDEDWSLGTGQPLFDSSSSSGHSGGGGRGKREEYFSERLGPRWLRPSVIGFPYVLRS